MLDYKTIYRDIAPKADILSGALAYARGRVGATGVVTLDILKEGAVTVVKSLAVEKMKPGIEHLLSESVGLFQLLNGERPADTDYATVWRDAFDAHLLNDIGADLQKAIGPSAIGEHFTDSDVDDPEVRSKVVHEIAERLAEAAMPMDTSNPVDVKPSVNKTLSAAGIVDADLAPHCTGGALQAVLQPSAPNLDEPTARAHVERLVGAWAISLGADAFDLLAADELIGCAFDDDHFLALNGIERMGGSTADSPFFMAYRNAAPLECKGNTLSAAMAALTNGALVELPKGSKTNKIKVGGAAAQAAVSTPAALSPTGPLAPPSAPAAPPVPLSTPQATVGAGTPSDDYADVVKIWRTHGKETDQSIGDAIGVSRPQVSNIAAGKAKLPLDVTKRAVLKNLLLTKAQELQRAAALLG